ncbi:glycosyltransferase [Haloarcula laminariae]|uniref:glycosyltransferase n=1 Tax=Haloarcula laminariae TaxID=2961577 RepID=UPI0024074C3E|nr:glycosyltransferase [Halomicroarcula sp. FL173]
MPNRLNVFQLITALQYGGAENMVADLVETVDDAAFTVGYMEAKDDLVERLVDAGATVESFDEGFRFDPRAFARLRRFLRAESFDVVHAHLPYAQTVGRLAAVGSGVDGVVSTQHNVADTWHPVTRATERATRPLDSVTVAVSNGVERSFTGSSHAPNRLGDDWCTIYNGIDVDGFGQRVDDVDAAAVREEFDLDPETLTLLNVGRYVPVKRQREAIRAVAQAPFDAQLLVVGDGPLKADLRAAAAELGVSDRVHVTGRVADIEPFYAVGDVFLAPSRAEGHPITLLEAMAAGLPVVATDIPGISEVVVDGGTGRLYEPGDIEALLAALARLRDPSLRREYGTAGRERARETFSVERMAASYGELYRQVAGR